ncbi:MAG: SRPBCC domain-containing protein [Terriglobales bacterium]
MAIKFSGEFEVKKNPEEVYDFLTDPNRFASLLPDFQNLIVQDATHFTLKVKVGISYIKGSADVKIELAEADRPRRAQYTGHGAVAGGSVTVVAAFDLLPVANSVAEGIVVETVIGTKVNWQGEAQIFGRLASAAGGMLEPLGKKQIQKLIDGLQAALG